MPWNPAISFCLPCALKTDCRHAGYRRSWTGLRRFTPTGDSTSFSRSASDPAEGARGGGPESVRSDIKVARLGPGLVSRGGAKTRTRVRHVRKEGPEAPLGLLSCRTLRCPMLRKAELWYVSGFPNPIRRMRRLPPISATSSPVRRLRERGAPPRPVPWLAGRRWWMPRGDSEDSPSCALACACPCCCSRGHDPSLHLVAARGKASNRSASAPGLSGCCGGGPGADFPDWPDSGGGRFGLESGGWG